MVCCIPAFAAAEEPSPAVSTQDSAPPRQERLVSPRVASLLAAAAEKKYGPPKLADKKPEKDESAATETEKPGDGIVLLPKYVVRERKLPSSTEVMTEKELARRAMEKYLGPEDGFDRGFLNLFTSEQIPILKIFGSVSNEARAMGKYREEERRQLKADLTELASLMKLSGDAEGSKKIKREVEKVFKP